MCKMLYIIILFIQFASSKFIFEDFIIEINKNKHNHDDIMLSDNYGNTIEPTIEPTLFPSYISTNNPSTEPTIVVINNKNTEKDKISDRNLAFIITFSIIGIITVISILYYKLIKLRENILDIKENIKENDIEKKENDILTILENEIYSEESRTVEIINEEKF